MSDEKKGANKEPGKVERTLNRSPNYPAFPLPEAIEKAKILWEKDHRAGSTVEAALQHLGFKAAKTPSGVAGRTLATLKKFGLTEVSGGRIHLSQIGLDIVVYQANDERHIKAVQQAAVNPGIYSKIRNKYSQGLLSDETLRSELIRDEGFNPKQVDGFIADLKKTFEFSGVTFHDEAVDEEDGYKGEEEDRMQQPMKTGGQGLNPTPAKESPTRAANSYPIPLKRQNEAVICFSRLPLEKSDLDLIKQWIDLMSANLTEVAEVPVQ